MSLHKITAGSGYDYLTRQVAAMDSTEKGHAGLASYYTEKGETPGVWVGSGMAGIDGLSVGDGVTAEQMTELFGVGHHPLARQRQAALPEKGLTEKAWREAARLGQPFKVYEGDVSSFRIEVARRLQQLNSDQGKPTRAATAIEDRARIRTQVATEMFKASFGRTPLDERELAGHIAKLSRQQTTAVAGYDLTFSPVKSVSALWALAPQPVAAAIETAHRNAVADALRFIEQHALFTRTGTNGVRQVEVHGLVAAAFTHRDSRAGDPDLHTHVAVANKVQTVADGRWLSIDGRVLHKAVVAASETYNTALERHLSATLGVRFAARPQTDPQQRPVREIVGVNPDLNLRWSTRRVSIEARRRDLSADFQRDHGRPPSPVESIALAQQATLETRDAKHEPRTLAEQRHTWKLQAIEVLGDAEAIGTMITTALHPTPAAAASAVDEAWVQRTAGTVLSHVQARRSHWQTWHLRAETHRHVRTLDVATTEVDPLVDRLVAQAVTLCQPLNKPTAGEPDEPGPLRRSDGASVYTVAGAQLYTSPQMLAAEARLVNAAGSRDGRKVPAAAVDVALLECAANGAQLNAGQVLLVKEMATSGARVQLAIAPAGSGKTTAMSALSRAWTSIGGTVIGLAPSAAAAAGLGEQMDGTADTLAKLVWALAHPESDQPAWVKGIGPGALAIIDEAGMADTLSLDAAVSHILAKGGSVRLIGDDQQLAAIGAGGVLRDIQASHGALHLSELVRFSDRAEGSASLALRDGRTSALGFYLDQRRIHVGDETTMADDLFAAWSADIAGDLDSIMLAPTRDLVAQLNQRARDQRLHGDPPQRELQLADGNHASVGDTIITRLNNRRLRTSATDWVKNGDRWHILDLARNGSIQARHTQSGQTVWLPADYVTSQVELGYACTTHTAQGVTADTMHGLLTGDESRQHTYTMLTRGRHTNHAYLVVVGDGDPHSMIRPETVNPLSPTDLLESILARDESPVSATTSLRQASDPTTQLGAACDRYSDAISFAAAHTADPATTQTLHETIEKHLPQLTSSESWPALRNQLLLVAADGRDPLQALQAACSRTVGQLDACTVLSWRIADAAWRNQRGPLPWLPSVPALLQQHPTWGPYLAARAALVTDLAGQVRRDTLTAEHRPEWVQAIAGTPSADLVADVQVWRAAHSTDPADSRPLGEQTRGLAHVRVQRRLKARLAECQSAALDEWAPLLETISPTICTDTFAPVLAARLSQLSSAGITTPQLLRHAANEGPLPDDHAAAALWWRLSRTLNPAIAADVDHDHHLSTAWLDTFTTLIGDRSGELQDSPWWTALVATIERGLQRGWTLQQLINEGGRAELAGHSDPCQGWVWRLSLLTDPIDPGLEETAPEDPAQQRPDDLPEHPWTTDETPLVDAHPAPLPDLAELTEPDPDPWQHPADPTGTPGFDLTDDAILTIQGMIRDRMGAPEATEADIRHMMERADQIANSPVPLERLHLVNQLTADFYRHHLTSSWAAPYLTGRLHTDLTQLDRFGAGYAPNNWTALVNHLHRHGITDLEALTAGVAQTASTGRLIDRFRDRAIFPIIHEDRVLGFVGRRNPTIDDAGNHGPKYLNTATTPIFAKGDQLFVAGQLQPGTIPVLGEGPLDAIALTLVGDDRYIGVAPLGTSLTENHVAQLHQHGQPPIIATDPDRAGQAAAERDYWMLTTYNLDPRHANLTRLAADPADLIAQGASQHLRDALTHARPLGEHLIDQRLTADPDTAHAILSAVQVLAAQPRQSWTAGVEHIAHHTNTPPVLVRSALAAMVKAWNADVRKAAQQAAYQAARRTNPARYETVTATTPTTAPSPHDGRPRHDAPGMGW